MSSAEIAGTSSAPTGPDSSIASGERVVTVATGTGLKDSASAREAVDDVISVDAAGQGLPEDL